MIRAALFSTLLFGGPVPMLAQDCSVICNGNFDSLNVTLSVALLPSDSTPCWHTTSSDDIIEVWHTGYGGVDSYSGDQFVEMNAYQPATLFQNIAITHPSALSISFAHRGRGGVDTMSVSVGPINGPYVELGSFGDGETGWGYYTVDIPSSDAWGDSISVRFNSIYWAFGNQGVGNLLDAVTICLTSTIGINEQVPNGSLVLHPGTAAGSFIVELPVGNGEFTVFDVMGRRLAGYATPNSRQLDLDMRAFAAGTYLLRFSNASGMVWTGRVVHE